MLKPAPKQGRRISSRREAPQRRSMLLTSGLFLNPFLPAAQLPSLRISVANEGTDSISTGVIVNALIDGAKQEIYRGELSILSKGVASARVELGEYEGRPVEVNVNSANKNIRPSVALVGTFSGDGSEDLLLNISPRQFAEVPGATGTLPVRLSSGLVYIPNLSGNQPDIRIFISNFYNRRSDAHIALYQVQGGKKRRIASAKVNIPSRGGAVYIRPLNELQGQSVEAVVVLPSQGLKASLSVIKTYIADGGEQTLLYMSPEQWKRF